jgi:hypothetical protein
MKRKRNVEKICSVLPSGDLVKNEYAKIMMFSKWERALKWANSTKPLTSVSA